MSHPIYDFGGSGPLIHLAVANGFPPQTYIPLVRPLLARYHVVSLPPRALWPGAVPPETVGTWRLVADDLLAGIRQHDLRNIIAIGHSFGGVATALAAIDEPARFRALALLDPTIMPPDIMNLLKAARDSGQPWEGPLVEGALRRRRQFESIEEAYGYFKEKPLFGNWPDETVRLYTESMMRPTPDGDGMELAWSPEWEVYYYRCFYPYTWDDAPKLRGLLPILAIRGGDTDSFPEPAAALLRRALPGMAYAEVAGRGHLFPLSAPLETGSIILRWLASRH
jgi:pimeloyl-ACP methyl ester carboxylesterase